jgi:group I intron endonuclease
MLIYCARNKDNDKMYIGKTTKTLEIRKAGHYDAAINSMSDTHFHRALRSGVEFEWMILETVSETNDINEREKFWMSKLDTYHNGYNMTIGGDGGLTYTKGDELYGRIKHKLGSPGNLNPGANPEIHTRAELTKLKNIQSGIFFNSGEAHGNFKGKFKKKHEKYKGGPSPKNSKRVIINGIEYDSLQAAAREYKICAETVSNRCSNTRYLDWNFI